MSNRILTPESIIFVEEPEAALHPEAIVRFLNVLSLLAGQGVQIFMATHSYFVLKKLQLLARQNQESVPVWSVSGKEPVLNDLKEGMPDNPIVNTSIVLYEQELEAGFGQ